MAARDVVLPHFPDLTADQLGQMDAIGDAFKSRLDLRQSYRPA